MKIYARYCVSAGVIIRLRIVLKVDTQPRRNSVYLWFHHQGSAHVIDTDPKVWRGSRAPRGRSKTERYGLSRDCSVTSGGVARPKILLKLPAFSPTNTPQI